MWFSFWRSKRRFSLDELRYLTEQLQKVQIVNEVNKDFVIEALRSIAELVTYGDQHDSAFFDFFMEKQVMGEFVRLLHISRTIDVSLQLLQTVSIMIQNLKDERAIHYLFSNEHINCLITYSFDFRNEELLSYYISFLRAISGKLDSYTISLLVKTENNVVVSFPLYVEALKFAFHDESMIRIAVRAITLNVYHVGDEGIDLYVASGHLANYFPDLISFFKKQCINLNEFVFQASKNPSQELLSNISSAVDEIEDNLFYISDVISAGIPDVGRLIADNLLQILILPMLLPSLTNESDAQILAITTMYLLCCILRIVKIKDLANTVAASLLCPLEVFKTAPESTSNGQLICSSVQHLTSHSISNHRPDANSECLRLAMPEDRSSLDGRDGSCLALRDSLLSYLANGDDTEVLGSLSVLAVLLQTKELDESALEALGILPQRKQHKKLLLRSLVGESLGEEQLFFSESRDSSAGELDCYLKKLKEQYGIACSSTETRSSPRLSRFQVLDANINLLRRTNISADVLWNAGWLLCQLFPYSKTEVNRKHLNLLRETYATSSGGLHREIRGIWADQVIKVLCDEWRNCKRVVEASFPLKELKYLLYPRQNANLEDVISSDSSIAAGEKMCKLAKEVVLLYQLQLRFSGKLLPDQLPLHPSVDMPEKGRARTVGMGKGGPRIGTELKLGDAIPCRISFGKGKERHFHFLAVSMGTSGWLILLEELPRRENSGLVRVMAPLAGANPRIDEKHARWLHLRIRPSTLPSMDDSLKPMATRRAKGKQLVDGRWTLAFKDDELCESALGMILEELTLQSQQIESQIKPLLNLQIDVDSSPDSPLQPTEESSSSLSSTMNL